jgi:hypothetical protein
MVWFPTIWGWICVIVMFSACFVSFLLFGEAYFCVTDRLPADVLVIEGWIGNEGIDAAANEYFRGGYSCVVTTSGLTYERWDKRIWSYAVSAREELIRRGVPADHVFAAPPSDTQGQRTYESALAVRQFLEASNSASKAINVFTLGAHARRSRLVFSKVLVSRSKVGCISWIPSSYRGSAWWRSSERSEDMIKEIVGYFYELLLNSGRWSKPAISGRPEASRSWPERGSPLFVLDCGVATVLRERLMLRPMDDKPYSR